MSMASDTDTDTVADVAAHPNTLDYIIYSITSLSLIYPPDSGDVRSNTSYVAFTHQPLIRNIIFAHAHEPPQKCRSKNHLPSELWPKTPGMRGFPGMGASILMYIRCQSKSMCFSAPSPPLHAPLLPVQIYVFLCSQSKSMCFSAPSPNLHVLYIRSQSNSYPCRMQDTADKARDESQQPAESKTTSATTEPLTRSQESESELCPICAESVSRWACGPCQHATCHLCALRLRVLYGREECALCKVGLLGILLCCAYSICYYCIVRNEMGAGQSGSIARCRFCSHSQSSRRASSLPRGPSLSHLLSGRWSTG
jgi:hypothetical protein